MDFQVTIQEGGFIEFERKGVYPRYILFNSIKLIRTWRFKLQVESQSGLY